MNRLFPVVQTSVSCFKLQSGARMGSSSMGCPSGHRSRSPGGGGGGGVL